MRLKCKTVMEGPGPSEAIVSIDLEGGREEELVISLGSVENETIEVGCIGKAADAVLIELPNESASGNWRVWVNNSSLL